MAITINWENAVPERALVRHMSEGTTFILDGHLYMYDREVRVRSVSNGWTTRYFAINLGTGKRVEMPSIATGEPVDIEITVVRK